MSYVDVFGITHDDCRLVPTKNEYQRVAIIEDHHGDRFTVIKDNPSHTKVKAVTGHWHYAKPSDAPKNYAVPYFDKQQR